MKTFKAITKHVGVWLPALVAIALYILAWLCPIEYTPVPQEGQQIESLIGGTSYIDLTK